MAGPTMADAASQPSPSLDLWADLQLLLQFHFMQNAVAAGTIVSVLAGLIGYFVVLRGQSFAAHTLSQVGFPGAAGAALLGVPPLAGLITFCVAAALGISALSRERGARLSETAAVGSILAFTLALGSLFARLYPGFVGAAYSFLFGTYLGITDTQVTVLLVTAIAAMAVLAVIGRPLLFASVDPDVAAARGVPVRLLSVSFLLLLGLAVAEAVQITGTLLVFALLVAPAATAQQLTARPVAGLILSVTVAMLVAWLGLAIAYFTPYPIGFFVTSIAFLVYVAARGWRQLRERVEPRPVPAT
jgi:zinc/manganese transport system permease protein